MIIEKINAALLEANTSPFERGGTRVLSFGADSWVGYVFGAIFIVIGIACFFLYPRSKRKADAYRQEQLKEYNAQRKGTREIIDYRKTGMYLPAWEKAKLFAPVFFGMVFCLIGIAWMVGNTLTSL